MNDSRQIDQASRRGIREALLENILVEAGAGSGKTQMLAERMAAGVATGVYQIEHMAAVTFTRKAASELRGRFHLALESQIANASADFSDDDDRLKRLRSAVSNLERFFAGTIHSFCSRLLRERPIESGVAPGFTELDEVQDLQLRQRAWREFVTGARAAGDPEMIALLQADVRPKDLDSVFATICDNEDVDFPAGEGVSPDPEPAWDALESFWKELQKYLPSPINTETTCEIQRAAAVFDGQLRVSRYRLYRPQVLASLLKTWDRESKITQKWWADTAPEKKRLAGLIEALHNNFRASVVRPFLDQWRQYVYRLAVSLLTRARATALAERHRLNSLNYSDLLNLTARVLRENVSVRRALQQKFRYLLVDEFQDTDPIQAEIIFWLAEDARASDVAPGVSQDWRMLPLRPGALFVVGDPKQSIYRFRRADIDIYNMVRDRFAETGVGRVLPLTLNFRASPELCEWANELFQTRFPKEPTTHAPRFAPLDADAESAEIGQVFTLTHACAKNEVQTEDAWKIAAYIRSEVDAGRRSFSDFLILTRKKRDRIAPFAHALEALNIPVEVNGAGAFGDSREVQTLTALLRALADPMDSVTLIAVLRGPLFGVSDPELFAFKKRGGRFSLFQSTEAVEHPSGPVSLALTTLSRYYRWTRVLPAAGALDRILEDSGYIALSATSPGGVDAGDVIHAIDRMRQVFEAGGSLADAANMLEADREAASEVESLPLEPGRTDVVRLMNLHKAKGLEANVVFLADPLGGVKPRVDVHIERTGVRSQGWLKLLRRSESSWAETLIGEHADWTTYEAAERPYLQAEENRLLYVAATRAREVLVVSRWTQSASNGAWQALDPFLKDARELVIPTSVDAAPVQMPDCSVIVQTTAQDLRGQTHARIHMASWSATSVSIEAKHVARMTQCAEPEADDPSKVVLANSPSHRADAGRAWGALIHGLLEHAMRHRNSTREDLRRLAVWLTVDEPQLRTVIDEALDTAQDVTLATFWSEAKASSECHEEVPFAVLDTQGGLPTVLNGVIDLVHNSDSGWKIIDYKTDKETAAESLCANYDAQILQYERAWTRFVSEPVVSALVSTRVGDFQCGASTNDQGLTD